MALPLEIAIFVQRDRYNRFRHSTIIGTITGYIRLACRYI